MTTPNDNLIIGQETGRATEPIRVGQIVYAQSATGRWSARLDSGESWYVREVDTIELLNALVASDRESEEKDKEIEKLRNEVDRLAFQCKVEMASEDAAAKRITELEEFLVESRSVTEMLMAFANSTPKPDYATIEAYKAGARDGLKVGYRVFGPGRDPLLDKPVVPPNVDMPLGRLTDAQKRES